MLFRKYKKTFSFSNYDTPVKLAASVLREGVASFGDVHDGPGVMTTVCVSPEDDGCYIFIQAKVFRINEETC